MTTTTDDNNIVGKHIEFIIDTADIADKPGSIDCIVAEYDPELGLSIVEAEDHTRYHYCFRTTYIILKRQPNNIGHVPQEESVKWLAELMEEVTQGYLKVSTIIRLEDKYNQLKRILPHQNPSADTCAFS